MGNTCCTPVVKACNTCLDWCGCDSDQDDIGSKITRRKPKRISEKVFPLGDQSSSDSKSITGPLRNSTAQPHPAQQHEARHASHTRKPLDSKPLTKLASRYGPQTFEWKGRVYDVAIESLAWTKCKNSQGLPFYYSPLTGQTTWQRPEEYIEPAGWFSSVATLTSLRNAMEACLDCGIELLLFGDIAQPNVDPTLPWQAQDQVYGGGINGFPPILGHCLFYQPFLISELSLYPKNFLVRCGVQRIVLVDTLRYRKQSRKAIPVVETGTVYIDPRPEAIQYMHSVFHHELFHIFDDKILSFLKGRLQYLPEPLPHPTTSQFNSFSVKNLSMPQNDAIYRSEGLVQPCKPQVDPLFNYAHQICQQYLQAPEEIDIINAARNIAKQLNIWDATLPNSDKTLTQFFPRSAEDILPRAPLAYWIKMLTKDVAFSDCPPAFELALLLRSVQAHERRRTLLNHVARVLQVDASLLGNEQTPDSQHSPLGLALGVVDDGNEALAEDEDTDSDHPFDGERQRIVGGTFALPHRPGHGNAVSPTSIASSGGDLHIEMEDLSNPSQHKHGSRSLVETSPNRSPQTTKLSMVDRQPYLQFARLKSPEGVVDCVHETKALVHGIISESMVEELNKQHIRTIASEKVDVEKIGSDPIWLLLNPPGFCYGSGGHKLRTKTSTFSMTHQETKARLQRVTNGKTSIEEKTDLESTGFLNEYSMSGIEEDKAELYAALIRSYTAVIHSPDKHIAAKGAELMRRLKLFCPEMDESFFQRAHEHQPFPVADAYSEHWVQRVDRRGYPHWFNTMTHQTSWIDPSTFLAKAPNKEPLLLNSPSGEVAEVSTKSLANPTNFTTESDSKTLESSLVKIANDENVIIQMDS